MSLRSCLYCCQEIRVENMHMLHMGQHITFPGERGLRHIEKKGTQKKWYKHHAIIKEVKRRSDFSADLVLIHFWSTDGDNKYEVTENTDSYNLSSHEIYIRKYKQRKYPSAEVVRRANSKKANESKYNIVTCNCEHLATWCVIGVRESRQVNFCKSLVRNLVICMIIFALCIVKTISTKPDKIVKKVAEVILLLSFLYSVHYFSYRNIYFIERYAIEKIICKSCLKMHLFDLWARFVLTLSIVILLKFYFRYTDEITTLITALIFYVTIGNIIKLIRKIHKNPYPDIKREIRRMSNIKIGDVISLNYEGSSYNIIVSSLPSERIILTKQTRGDVSGIFYDSPSLFHSGIIKERFFKLDLTRHNVMFIHYAQFRTHPSDKVVARARKRIGEKKYNWFSNRSRHFCHWAKVNEHRHKAPRTTQKETGANSDTNLRSSLLIEIVEVRIREEICIGDIVELKSFGPFTDSGIVVDIVNDAQDQIFTMNVVLKKGLVASIVKMVSCKVDLRVDHIWIHRYHPVHCYRRAEYIQRAIKKIGEVCEQWTQTRFVRDCIIRPLTPQK
ncbi:hypothetical protein CHS0354_002340 [Potamilus streckersoni]|nr:hypothetical protein CHS0354_002340 [Potamilus streckersoni]